MVWSRKRYSPSAEVAQQHVAQSVRKKLPTPQPTATRARAESGEPAKGIDAVDTYSSTSDVGVTAL